MRRLTFLTFFLYGCTYRVPDIEVCIEVTRENAFCNHSLSEAQRTIPADTWKQERIGRLSLSPNDYGKLLYFVKSVCEESKRCTYDEAKAIKTFVDETQKKAWR